MNMELWYTTRIVSLIKQAQAIGEKHGHKYILRQGLIREIIISSALGHYVHTELHQHDAYNPDNPEEHFEYMTTAGSKFTFSSMLRGVDTTRERIMRNKYVYFVRFNADNPLDIEEIYEVDPDKVWTHIKSAFRGTTQGRKANIHVGMPWVRANGRSLPVNIDPV